MAIPVKTRASVTAQMPPRLKQILNVVMSDPLLNEGVVEMMGRSGAFPSPQTAALAGIGVSPAARRYVDQELDLWWEVTPRISPPIEPEVIVGSGIHSAIYCAVRHRMGKPPPLVLEAKKRVGGVYAVSAAASFYLNSRNRPGGISIPGEKGALNVIPGAPVQPSDLGGSEYQENDALAWVVRIILAMYARVIPEKRVNGIDAREGELLVSTEQEDSIRAKRVIFAPGLGKPRTLMEGDRFISFEGLMGKMDDPFPLRGMKRVAVVGAGDSGKTAIEGLTGQGPGRGMSVASLDWIEKIDWYGVEQFNREEWVRCNRSRYKGIGGLLPSVINTLIPSRVNPLPKVPDTDSYYTQSYQLAYVGEVPYDYVVVCTGYDAKFPDLPWEAELISRRRVGRYAPTVGDVHLIGPASKLEVDDREKPLLKGISENETSIFRYAPRTALLAMSLE